LLPSLGEGLSAFKSQSPEFFNPVEISCYSSTVERKAVNFQILVQFQVTTVILIHLQLAKRR
jgi:hypothetical protein